MPTSHCRAFTLIELLVVIAIIALLVTLLAYREHNVAYSDGHAETRHKTFTAVYPAPYWDNYYLLAQSEYWLY